MQKQLLTFALAGAFGLAVLTTSAAARADRGPASLAGRVHDTNIPMVDAVVATSDDLDHNDEIGAESAAPVHATVANAERVETDLPRAGSDLYPLDPKHVEGENNDDQDDDDDAVLTDRSAVPPPRVAVEPAHVESTYRDGDESRSGQAAATNSDESEHDGD
ncbi:MAG: hypothetical protein NVSMB64_10650 [Candidatus Velthaea sp.]